MNKPGWNYWPVVILGLLWNLMGCLNFVVQRSAEMIATMPASYQLIIIDRPAWATAAFGIAVFAGAVGCILLLLRRVVAVPVLALSVLGVLVTIAFVAIRAGVVSDVMVSTGLSLAVALILLWTASMAKGRGWLR